LRPPRQRCSVLPSRGSPHVPADASVTAKPRLTYSSIGEGQQGEPEEQWYGAL
jgi:hypothetical protein